ncbi:MAG: pytH [Verrucomicrobia bacterium]|nr:pytH [Verrucomicrobiota bacterium]
MKVFFRWFVLVAAATFLVVGAESQKSPTKPVVVFVHGAWGGGWQFRKIDPLMQARGYVVYRPTLTGLGERVHLATRDVGLETHIQDIVNVIRFENLHDVILVGHSYGGMVVTGVADRMPERIARIVYLDALLPENGDSVSELEKGRGPALAEKAKDGFIAPWWVKPDKPYPRDVPHPVKTLEDRITLTNPAARKIPAVYILTVEKGHAAADDDFAPFAERARKRNWPVIQMEGDHNPYWFKPEETAEILDQACRMKTP